MVNHVDVNGDYSQSDLLDGLKKAGIVEGDVVYVVADLKKLGTMADCSCEEGPSRRTLETLQDAVGVSGTLVVPTYTFSFCRRELFDVQSTPAIAGPWSPSTEFLEYVRKLPGAIRSTDPIHSVAAIGAKAAEIVSNVPPTCFGRDSIPDRLKKAGAKLCAIGVGLHEANFQHHVEEMLGVPFRFKKLFTGYVVNHGIKEKKGWIYNVGILAENGVVDERRIEDKARAAGICLASSVGNGEILCAASAELFDFISQAVNKDPWVTAKGPGGDPVELERLRVNGPEYTVTLPRHASMPEMVEALWKLPRDIVSEGYDAALRALATQVPMHIHEYPTGTECWSWIIPEKWTCYEAYLESRDGTRLFSYVDNPLHVVSYSLPFEGEVSREELFEHLHVHPKISDAIPFMFKYYERDWGLCCSQVQKDQLRDDAYKVVIKSVFSFGTLKVGEVIAKGESEECIVLCAHLCHPAMVNDDLAGVVVGMKVMQALLARTDLRYTYRFLILPETIGSVAYLSQNKHLIPKMKGGLFLEMLGLGNSHALQLSFAGNTEVDMCFSQALREQGDPGAWIGAYRTVIGNDERQFNGPGVRVPMLSLSRVLSPTLPDWPYREYHSSHDAPSMTSYQNLESSCDMVLTMIDLLEKNSVPVNQFQGEIFCSRFDVSYESLSSEEYRALFSVMDLIDGTHSIVDIANRCSISFETAWNIVNELRVQGLVSYGS